MLPVRLRNNFQQTTFNLEKYCLPVALVLEKLLWISARCSYLQEFGSRRTQPNPPRCSAAAPDPAGGGDVQLSLSLSLSHPLQGAKRSVALILALAKATCSSGLQKNSHFLSGTRWGAPSFLCSLVLPRRLLSDLSSRGLVKITWQGRVKGPDEPRVPGVPQTSAELSVLLKWRGHWKGGASSRQGVSHYWICRKVARWVNKFLAHSKLLQPLGIKFNLHNMLEPLWCKWISFFFFFILFLDATAASLWILTLFG